MQYNITYDSGTSEPVTNTVLPSECSSAGECSHTFTVPVDGSASQYSVSVTAVGLEVTSDTRTVGTYISKCCLCIKIDTRIQQDTSRLLVF